MFMKMLIFPLLAFLSNQVLEMVRGSWWTLRAPETREEHQKSPYQTPQQFGVYFEFVSA